MENLEIAFKAMSGKFVGRGINHELQPFTGILQAKPVSQYCGIALEFQAIGDDGTAYHSEASLLGKTTQGTLGLWVLSSNHPGVFERTLLHADSLQNQGFVWVFGFGKRDDKAIFREEIRIECQPSLSVKYVYSWGLPGGNFAERSGVLMKFV